MIAVFINNKLISADNIVPLMMEMQAEQADLNIQFFCLNYSTFTGIKQNVVLWDAINSFSSLRPLGSPNRSKLGRLLHKFYMIPLLSKLLFLAISNQLTTVHFGLLNYWPLRLLWLVNSKKTVFVQSAPFGHSKTETATDNIARLRKAPPEIPAASSVICFEKDWDYVASLDVPKLVLSPTVGLPSWETFIRTRAENYFDREFARANIASRSRIMVFVLGYLDSEAAFPKPGMMLELFHETMEIMLEKGNGPIFIKPHVITDAKRLADALKRYEGRDIIVTNLHPAVLAMRADFFISNLYSTTQMTARYLGVPTIEYTLYNSEVLKITNMGSIRASAINYFIQKDKKRLGEIVYKLVKSDQTQRNFGSALDKRLKTIIN